MAVTGRMALAMQGLAQSVTDLGVVARVYDYPVEAVSPPCVVVGFPTKYEFDTTFQRGADTMEIPVWLVAGKARTLDARDTLSAILDGAASIKSALDGNHTYGAVRVTDAVIDEITIGGVVYASARFDTEVIS